MGKCSTNTEAQGLVCLSCMIRILFGCSCNFAMVVLFLVLARCELNASPPHQNRLPFKVRLVNAITPDFTQLS